LIFGFSTTLWLNIGFFDLPKSLLPLKSNVGFLALLILSIFSCFNRYYSISFALFYSTLAFEAKFLSSISRLAISAP